MTDNIVRVAILYPGDETIRRESTPDNNRLATVFQALKAVGIEAEPAVYHDDFCDEVRQQLLKVDGVLVWRNPVQDGYDRSVLDPMLREVAEAGVFVSTHPDIIMKMGTKEVVYNTRSMGWGCDTHLYQNISQMQDALPKLLAAGPRVLKQLRGSSGNGVWKIELEDVTDTPLPESIVRVRHATRGSVEETMPLSGVYDLCGSYFEGQGRVIDQQYQERLPDGMIRCYLTQTKVVGFGHQEINALFPAPAGALPEDAPQPGKRLYYPPDKPEFQALKRKVEQEWVAQMQEILEIPTDNLPMLWDCDFMFGPKDNAGNDTYVLCEINVSSVAPYPESAPEPIAKAVLARLKPE